MITSQDNRSEPAFARAEATREQRDGRGSDERGRSASSSGDRNGSLRPGHRARGPGIESSGDEAVPQAVRADAFGDSCPAGDPFPGPVSGVTVHPLTVQAEEDRSDWSFADVQLHRSGCTGPRGTMTPLPPFRMMRRV